MHNMYNTANFSDWLVFQNQGFSLVAMQTSIYQSRYDFSQPDFHHTCPSHIKICHACLMLWENLQAYNIEGTVQQEKEDEF